MSDLKKLAYDSGASQEGWEMWQMLLAVADLDPQVIVEVGCDKGGFLKTLAEAFPAATIVGIEEVQHPGLADCTVIYGNSHAPETVDKLLAAIDNRKIDFLFIDGDHRYPAVKKDYETYSPLVRKGGIVGFHDINSRDIEGVEAGVFFSELDKQRPRQVAKVASFQQGKTTPGTGIVWL